MSSARDLPRIGQDATDLLARAALAPEADARAAWQAWRKNHDIDSTPWNQVRLLGAVAARIHWLESDAAIRPRILGIRKFLWVQNQICLKHAIGGVAALERAGIPALLMKGAARIACDLSAARERLIRDVDVLVPIGQEERAFELLESSGWSLVQLAWQIRFRELSPHATHHAWSLEKDRSEIDLHHFSNYLNRLSGDDDGLWRRARTLEWQGATVRVPSSADGLLIALVHGLRWSIDAAADWTIDAAAILDEGRLDWAVFVEEAKRRMIQSIMHSGLRYLRDALGKPVPDSVLEALHAQRSRVQDAELAQYAHGPQPRDLPGVLAAGVMAARRALSRAGIREPASGHKAVPYPVERLSIRLPPAGGLAWFTSPHRKCATDWLVIRAEVAIRDPDQAPVLGQFEAPGLVLCVTRGTSVTGPAGVPVMVYDARIPTSLLTLRGIDKLAFRRMPTGPGARPEGPLGASIASFAVRYAAS